MNLLQIRQNFVKISGRYDLVVDTATWADNGADFMINAAVDWLDRKTLVSKSYASHLTYIDAGTLIVPIPFCRAIKEVWITTSEGRWQLEKKDLQWIMAEYLYELPNERSNGTPLYYAPTVTRYIPEDQKPNVLTTAAPTTFLTTVAPATEVPTLAEWLTTITVEDGRYNAVIMNVPVDEYALIDIRGLFYSIELEDNTDTNFWTEVHPMILVKAACRESYVLSGNSPMLKSTEEELIKECHELGMDLVDQVIAEIDQIED